MARKKTKQAEAPQDRRSIDALAALQAVPVEIENPHDLDRGKIIVLASTRDDILRRLLASKGIDEAQFAAGRAWEEDWQRAQLGHTSSGGQWQERVQSSGISGEIITDAVRRAVKNLAEADKELGVQGSNLVRDILGRGLTTQTVAIKYLSAATERNTSYITKRFGECLETLVVVYQLGGARSERENSASWRF